MSKERDQISKLLPVVEMQYQRSQQGYKQILAHEARVRGKLQQLTEQERKTRNLNVQETRHMRAMGADVLWEKWIESSKTQLNYELARVLAQKELHIERVRRDFGKQKNVQKKSQQLQFMHKKKTAQQQLEQAIFFANLE